MRAPERIAGRAGELTAGAVRLGRRAGASARRWLETTDNLVHVSALLFVPLVLALVTVLSNTARELSFLLFPPLASGAYTLFADPEGRYAAPRRFVVGLTAGAACGWLAQLVADAVVPATGTVVGINPVAAGLALFVTGAFTWAIDVEEPAAFSTALLVLATGTASPLEYVASVAVSSTLVAGAFVVWRSRVYERRAEYLYRTTGADDRVLVPMRGPPGEAVRVARFAARLAAAHDAGRVVLLDVVAGDAADADGDAGVADVDADGDAGVADADADGDAGVADVDVDADADGDDRPAAATDAVRVRTDWLRDAADVVANDVGVPCDVVVTSGSPADATLRTAAETGSDLLVVPYEAGDEPGVLAPYLAALFAGPLDVVALRPGVTEAGEPTTTTAWRDVLVMMSRPGDSAHAMIDFAERLAGDTGQVSVSTCIASEDERRPAEDRLANVVGTARRGVETRVARSPVESFVRANADAYDVVLVGSSGDRGPVSRLVSPPTATRLGPLPVDVAVVDRADF